MLSHVDDAHFDAEVLESDRPVLVDFWASWCPPCRVMEPILEQLADERPDIRVVKLDADANQETIARYGVMSMPTLMVFEHGQPVLSLIGSRPKARLERELEDVLPVRPAVAEEALPAGGA